MALFRPPISASWDCLPTLGHCWHCLLIALFARFTLKASPALRSRLLHFLLAWGHLPVFWPGISFQRWILFFSWDSGVLLSDDSILEIYFWYSNVDSLNVEFVRGYNRYRVSFSYASDSACGALSSPPLDWFVCSFVFCFFIRIGPQRKRTDFYL